MLCGFLLLPSHVFLHQGAFAGSLTGCMHRLFITAQASIIHTTTPTEITEKIFFIIQKTKYSPTSEIPVMPFIAVSKVSRVNLKKNTYPGVTEHMKVIEGGEILLAINCDWFGLYDLDLNRDSYKYWHAIFLKILFCKWKYFLVKGFPIFSHSMQA